MLLVLVLLLMQCMHRAPEQFWLLMRGGEEKEAMFVQSVDRQFTGRQMDKLAFIGFTLRENE